MYIITDDLSHNGYFYPRIPKNRLLNENSSRERICLSKTIEGCLTAFPRGGDNLKNTLSINLNVLKVFKICPEKLNIKKSSIKNPFEIMSYVPDALITEEYWITESFQVPKEDIFYIYCYEWNENIVYNEKHERFVIITELDYDILNSLMKNMYYSFEIDSYFSLDKLISYLKIKNIEVNIKTNNLTCKNIISFKTNDESIDISNYFVEWCNIYHENIKKGMRK